MVGAIDKEKLSQNSLQEDQDHHAPPEAARGDQQPVGAMQVGQHLFQELYFVLSLKSMKT